MKGIGNRLNKYYKKVQSTFYLAEVGDKKIDCTFNLNKVTGGEINGK